MRFKMIKTKMLSGLAALLSAVPMMTAGCATDAQVIDQAQAVHQELQPAVVLPAGREPSDAELAAYVQKVGDRIVAAAREVRAQGGLSQADDWMFEDIQFHLVADPTLNAFTTGGKHVYMYSGLFEGSETEDAFAAVVGHEFGHIIGRHVQSSMDRQMAVLAGSGLAGLVAALATEENQLETGAAVAGGAATVGTLFGQGFGREQEREADKLGFYFYVQAGYDPDQFASFFETMIAQQGAQTPGGLDAYLSSHPTLASRVEAAKERASRVTPEERRRYARPPIVDQQAFNRLKERSIEHTKLAQQKAATNQDTAAAVELLQAFPRCVEPREGEAVSTPTPPRER